MTVAGPLAPFVDRARRLKENGLAGDSAWGLLHEGITLVATMVAFTLLGRSLGTAGYGDYASLYSIVGPLGNLAASGVPLALMQHVLRDREVLADTVGSCTSLTLLFGTGLAVVGVMIGAAIVPALPVVTVALVIVLEFLVIPLSNVASTAIQTQAGYTRATQLRTVQVIVRLVIILVLHAMGDLTVASLAATHLVVSVLITGLMLHFTARFYGYEPWPKRVRRRHAATSVSYSIGITGITLQNDGDKATLASYGYREETGLYSAAYRIVQFGLLPVGVLTGATHQRFLHHEEGEKDQHLKRAIKYAGVTVGYGLVFMVGVIAIAPILPRLVGEDFRESVTMVRWLAPLVLLRGLAMFPVNALMGLGKTFMRSLLLVATAGLSMVLYITLIPIWNWKGAVAGTMIGEAALAAAAWYFLLRYQRLDNARIEAAAGGAGDAAAAAAPIDGDAGSVTADDVAGATADLDGALPAPSGAPMASVPPPAPAASVPAAAVPSPHAIDAAAFGVRADAADNADALAAAIAAVGRLRVPPGARRELRLPPGVHRSSAAMRVDVAHVTVRGAGFTLERIGVPEVGSASGISVGGRGCRLEGIRLVLSPSLFDGAVAASVAEVVGIDVVNDAVSGADGVTLERCSIAAPVERAARVVAVVVDGNHTWALDCSAAGVDRLFEERQGRVGNHLGGSILHGPDPVLDAVTEAALHAAMHAEDERT